MIKFFVSRKEMELLHMKVCINDGTVGGRDYDDMVVLAATLEGCQDFEAGDIVWAKLAGLYLTDFRFLCIYYKPFFMLSAN